MAISQAISREYPGLEPVPVQHGDTVGSGLMCYFTVLASIASSKLEFYCSENRTLKIRVEWRTKE